MTLAKRRHRLALALSVEDNGPGVRRTIRDRIFYPLVSGREGGSGLGLTIAQTFIAQHNGTIECESAPGTYGVHDTAAAGDAAHASATPSRKRITT